MIPVYAQQAVSPAVEAAMFDAMTARFRREGHTARLPDLSEIGSDVNSTRKARSAALKARLAEIVSDYPGITTKRICDMLGSGVTSVQFALGKMVDAGDLTAERVVEGGRIQKQYFSKADGADTPPAATEAEGGPQS